MTRTLSILAAAALLAGCATSNPALDLERQQREQAFAELRASRDALQAELAVVRDSLRFLDDIDSGRYYDRTRTLTNRIDRLEYEVALLQDGGVPVAVIPADDLFESGTATLSLKGRAELLALVQELNGRHKKAAVNVEGHTDNVPLGPKMTEKYGSNWELSAARASAVVRHLIDEHELEAERFTVVGHGAARPIASTQTAEGRRQNRRIEITALIPIGEPGPPVPRNGLSEKSTARRNSSQ